MSITVHHLELSRSLRVLWALEELGLGYEIRPYERDENFRAPNSARSVHPLGRFPMLEIDGRVLAESGAVLEYLANREGKLRPEGEDARLEYDFFLHYAEGSVMPPLLVQLILDRLKTARMPFLVRPVTKRIAGQIEKAYSRPALDLHLGFVEETLAKRPYFAGESFSFADIQMFYPVEAGLMRGQGKYPNMEAWRARVTEREAYRRAAEKGGPAVPKGADGSA